MTYNHMYTQFKNLIGLYILAVLTLDDTFTMFFIWTVIFISPTTQFLAFKRRNCLIQVLMYGLCHNFFGLTVK